MVGNIGVRLFFFIVEVGMKGEVLFKSIFDECIGNEGNDSGERNGC